jgi:hypothetical protein
MASRSAEAAARRGSQALLHWQLDHPGEPLDLRGADLSGADLRWVNFAGADLTGCTLAHADLTGAYFGPWTFGYKPPHVSDDNGRARLVSADLTSASLLAAVFNHSVLDGASLRDSDQGLTVFRAVRFVDNDVSGARMAQTAFLDSSLDGLVGLDQVLHYGPSHLDQATIERSPDLPDFFRSQVGAPSQRATAVAALSSPPARSSCFLSHSSADEVFVKALYRHLVASGIRVWYAPEDLRGGARLADQIKEAIGGHDRLILVLSETSIASPWVERELRWARQIEAATGRQVLFPITICELSTLRSWQLIDATTGEDLAEYVRSFYLPDFGRWEDPSAFAAAARRLLEDLTRS